MPAVPADRTGCHPSAPAQIKKVLPFDIAEQIALGKAAVTVVPRTAGADSTKPFDGNAFTEYAQKNADSLVVHAHL